MHPVNKVRCENIGYRQGFIEVIPNIHRGYINIETWMISPEIKITDIDISEGSIADKNIVGNTEIEMSIDQAEMLIQLIQAAIFNVKVGR